MQSIASARSLLLNSSYEPMRIVSWQKALILWLQEKVDILEYHSSYARSSRSSFQLPSVLRLRTYVRPKLQHGVRFCRENVYVRDNYTCQYCAVQFPPKLLTLDHVVPASRNGEKSWTNVVCACRDCNQRKADRTPAQAGMPLLKEPRVPSWLPVHDFDAKMKPIPSVWRQYLSYKVG